MYSPARAGNIIIACTVLHNLMVRAKYPEPPEREIAWNVEWERRNAEAVVVEEAELVLNSNNICVLGFAARDRLIREFF